MADNTALVPPSAAPRSDVLVALTPAEMPAVQAQLRGWLQQKMRTLKHEIEEFEDHRRIATANGWKLSSVTSAIGRTNRQIAYYDKVLQAVEAGFLIIPNLPFEVLAVRMKHTKTGRQTVHCYTSRCPENFSVKPQTLPAGEGRYVDDEVGYINVSYDKPDGKGGTVREPQYIPARTFDDYPDFPMIGVKPVVLQATERAMAFKIFDEIGVVRDSGGGTDPIMVGRVRDPRPNKIGATFFLAWWLDPETL